MIGKNPPARRFKLTIHVRRQEFADMCKTDKMCKAILVDGRDQKVSNFGFDFHTEREVRHILGVGLQPLPFDTNITQNI